MVVCFLVWLGWENGKPKLAVAVGSSDNGSHSVRSQKSGPSTSELEANDKAAEVEVKDEPKSSVKDLTVDKELLQAFRFFDRNRVGYIKVEDMRVILHNLGKFISHRDIKELVQNAMLESNTARDNHIYCIISLSGHDEALMF
ncbi:hypothetical protein IFM89_032054 [Coptis chinensis]|uniref:EF-hand domain-containing protein n=1 Tax=Coptis chinensis TaxID=261450 RepID=A0A835I4C8_9MAGN|nr:hypothetical protein IFM89_032054 [Coptis chinensis]